MVTEQWKLITRQTEVLVTLNSVYRVSLCCKYVVQVEFIWNCFDVYISWWLEKAEICLMFSEVFGIEN